MPELPDSEPSAETVVLDHVETESAPPPAPTKPVPWMPILVGVGVLVLVGLIVVIVMLLTRPATSITVPQAVASPTASATPSASPSASPTPTPTPAVAAPAPADPAPAEPAPADPAPAPAPADPAPPLPAPPAPEIPPLSIDSMSALITGACDTSTTVTLSWTSTSARALSSIVNIRSGGGTPIVNESVYAQAAEGQTSFTIDCTRPLWFFKLSITNSDGSESRTGLLTFGNGQSQGWSSN